MHRIIVGIVAILALQLGLASGPQAQTLEAVKARGQLVCGVNEGLVGFASRSASGEWSGFDVDFCRAVSAAVLGDAAKVAFVPLSASDRFDALRSGKIDILSRNSSWTLSRELEYGLSFAAITYFDGQGFMVPRSAKVNSALELGGSKVCVLKDTTTQHNLADYFEANSVKFEAVLVGSAAEALERYKKKDCLVLTSDVSQLYAQRLELADAGEHLILPDVISKEPLGPAVRLDDPKWRNLVQWVHFAMLDAEELGVSKATLDQAKDSTRPAIKRLLGTEGKLGPGLGLANEWAANVVRQVGNYGEVFERNLGDAAKLGIPRGLNQLWSLGGVQYAPPVE
ncbi:amino acid ABC transporter substrate-binding protein [Labrys sp. ZIDIC5]|uniref:amino acid ABC transporter substrate-binding protein n=1 Tax=Labrys sedimenti TaxID=3106036 RepID=UPI002ACA64C9|nr:amino acid ABC transporter substrate-binding protein [Labrys sp. ZIDIC5]MDZ5453118.1 amino acid ABC transporter substrate-binding protein [Labrys sp. ZIDIC5]